MQYRKDIQILRGVAVLLVVLFHLEIAGFESGFLGVDVFFVISGYLMAVMYDPTKTTDFFIKRARRLLPAYFAVVIGTLLLAIAITTPGDYAQVAKQARFSTFFAPNIGFWLENSYFSKAAFKPLLHLWSLGIEIQFYLLVPLLAWAFSKWKPSYAIALIGSAALCFLLVGISPKASFFWLPPRLWEFLLGFGIAKYFYRGPRFQALGLMAFLTLICIPLVQIDGDALGFVHGHPGLMALLSCTATAAVLACGLPRKIEEACGLLERIGGWSYSIYLAHFPVIVLFLYQPFSGTVLTTTGIGQTATLAVLVATASALLFRFVEQPFRKALALRWITASAIITLVIGALGVLIQNSVIPEKEMLIYQAWFDRGEARCGKIRRLLHPFAISCEITEPIISPSNRVLLVGNSHADSIKSTFASIAQERDISVYFMVKNNPLMSGGITPEELIREALFRSADTIVLHYSPSGITASVVDEVS